MISAFRIFLALAFTLQLPLTILHSQAAYAKAKKAAAKISDDDEDDGGKQKALTAPSPDNDEDDECEGDPYLRCERAYMKNQNCDPTFLLDLYKHFRSVNCLTSMVGFCLSPSDENVSYGVYTGIPATAASLSADYARHKNLKINPATEQRLANLEATAARLEAAQAATAAQLEAEQAVMVKQIHAVKAAVAAENAAAGILPGTPQSLVTAQVEKKVTAVRLARAVFKGAGRGFALGLAVTVGSTFWDSEYRHAITEFISNSVSTPTACDAIDENDPNFLAYVPKEPGTCRTPIYTPGHPKVLAFLELPTEQKLKILRENPLVCGFYKSLNNELLERIQKLNGKTRVKNVQCNANGDIVFQSQQRTPEIFYKIHRDPKKKDLLSYSYEQSAQGDIPKESATFTLTKEDDDNFTVSRTSVYNNVSGLNDLYSNNKLVAFSRGMPLRATKTFDAFRTIRKYAPVLTLCCDNPPPQLKEYKKTHPDHDKMLAEQKLVSGYNKICHPNWFNRSAAPAMINSKATTGK